MQLNELQRNTARKYARSVGRGGRRGKTSGRGTKGQKARSGRKLRPEIRDTIKKFPKLRGRGKNSNTSIVDVALIIKTSALEKHFASGDSINPKTLVEKGLLKVSGRSLPRIKILTDGTVTKKFAVAQCAISASAKLAIEKAGGSVA